MVMSPVVAAGDERTWRLVAAAGVAAVGPTGLTAVEPSAGLDVIPAAAAAAARAATAAVFVPAGAAAMALMVHGEVAMLWGNGNKGAKAV